MLKPTDQWVDKVHETQQKDRENREHQGKGQTSRKLANKQHANNK